MAGTLHHHLLPFLLIAFSIICAYAYSSDIAHSPSAGPTFHHNGKPLPGHNPSLPPQSHDKHSPIPIHKPPLDHMKPPTSSPHPLDFPHPSSLISKSHPPLFEQHQAPNSAQDGRHPSLPGKPHYPINPSRVHMVPTAAPHDQYQNPTPYKPRPLPTNQHRSPSPLSPKTPLHNVQMPSPFNRNTHKPIHHGMPIPPSHSPHFYKSPPPHNRHAGIYTAPPPIQH